MSDVDKSILPCPLCNLAHDLRQEESCPHRDLWSHALADARVKLIDAQNDLASAKVEVYKCHSRIIQWQAVIETAMQRLGMKQSNIAANDSNEQRIESASGS